MKKFRSYRLVLRRLILPLFIVLPLIARADDDYWTFFSNRRGPRTKEELFLIITNITDKLFNLLLLLAVALIVIAGYYYLTSAGKEERVRLANRVLLYSLIAVVVGFVSRGIVIVTGLLITF